MSNIPAELKYTADHEWVQLQDDRARVGVTYFAQEQLGDVVYVELPKVGTAVTVNKAMGVVESVKAASDIYSPVTGTIVAVNDDLGDQPELVNSDPYGAGWMVEIELASMVDADGLLDAAAYEATLEG